MTTGILTIFNDCRADRLDEYEAWYRDEHLPERLSIPGIRRGRRYIAAGEGTTYFTYYETDTPEVLTSPVYLERLENPTPRTHAIMTGSFLNMNRTICRVAARKGRLRGAWAVVQQLDAVPDVNLAKLVIERGVARAEIWESAQAPEATDSAEARLRGGDRTMGACLFIETLQRADAEWLERQFPGAMVYQFLCEMTEETG